MNDRPDGESRRGRFAHYFLIGLSIATMGAAVVVLFRLIDPSQSALFPRCMFHALTGWFCPGCGATRAVHALVNGRLADAVRFNPLLILGTPAFILALALRRYRELRGLRTSPLFAPFAAAVIIAFMAARNIPGLPSQLTAPPPARPVAQ